MRRRGDDTRISFFSFQDIITSIAGIMIFIALMLILDVATSVSSGGGAPPVVTTPKDEAARRIRHLQEQLAELRAANERVAREASVLAAVDNTQLQVQIRQLERELDAVRQRHAQVSAQRKAQEKQLGETLSNNKSMHEEISALAQAKAKIDRESRKVIVTLKGQDEGKSVVVVELSRNKALVGLLNSNEPPQVLSGNEPDRLADQVTSCVRGFDFHKADVLILYKPSAFEYQKLVPTLLDGGFRVGSEPLPEDRSAF